MSESINVCPLDGEPVVWTFEFPGAEYHCVVCGWAGGVFTQRRAPATPELLQRAEELSDRYDRERAAREGRPPPEPMATDRPRPVCRGCGKHAQGRIERDGKPAHWYMRTIAGVDEFACSRECITEGSVLPW